MAGTHMSSSGQDYPNGQPHYPNGEELCFGQRGFD